MKHPVTLVLAILTLCSLGIMSAQQQQIGLFSVGYFSNNTTAGAPDGTVRINNPGSSDEEGVNVCAMIYVFDNDQEMNECCGCLTTPDGLRTLSIKNDLTSNPLTVKVNTGDIKIIPAYPNASPCDPSAAMDPTEGNGLNVWGTHIQNKVGTGFPITETAFTISSLSYGEFLSLEQDCYFTIRLGSGRGVCSCGTGD
jgi:hypothetical protein